MQKPTHCLRQTVRQSKLRYIKGHPFAKYRGICSNCGRRDALFIQPAPLSRRSRYWCYCTSCKFSGLIHACAASLDEVMGRSRSAAWGLFQDTLNQPMSPLSSSLLQCLGLDGADLYTQEVIPTIIGRWPSAAGMIQQIRQRITQNKIGHQKPNRLQASHIAKEYPVLVLPVCRTPGFLDAFIIISYAGVITPWVDRHATKTCAFPQYVFLSVCRNASFREYPDLRSAFTQERLLWLSGCAKPATVFVKLTYLARFWNTTGCVKRPAIPAANYPPFTRTRVPAHEVRAFGA